MLSPTMRTRVNLYYMEPYQGQDRSDIAMMIAAKLNENLVLHDQIYSKFYRWLAGNEPQGFPLKLFNLSLSIAKALQDVEDERVVFQFVHVTVGDCLADVIMGEFVEGNAYNHERMLDEAKALIVETQRVFYPKLQHIRAFELLDTDLLCINAETRELIAIDRISVINDPDRVMVWTHEETSMTAHEFKDVLVIRARE